MKNADTNPLVGKADCYKVVFTLQSKVTKTNVWVDFTAYVSDNLPLDVGDSLRSLGSRVIMCRFVV